MTIRILLSTLGEQWTEALTEILEADQELEIVASVEDPLELLIRVDDLAPDVVLLQQLPGGHEPGICSHLLLEHPNLAVVLVPESPGSNALLRMMLCKESWRRADRDSLRAAFRNGRRN